jgi:DNA-binding MurR/RpiR family transcriptional regulator
VVRFCRSVGYDGLADFKLKLAGSVSEGVPFVHRAVDDDDKAGELAVKVIDNAVSALLKYRNAAASHDLERAIEVLAEAGRSGRRIEFYGVGNSGIVAQDAQHKFFRLGVSRACRQRRPRAGHERHHAAPGRLRGGHQQLRPQPRPASTWPTSRTARAPPSS